MAKRAVKKVQGTEANMSQTVAEEIQPEVNTKETVVDVPTDDVTAETPKEEISEASNESIDMVMRLSKQGRITPAERDTILKGF